MIKRLPPKWKREQPLKSAVPVLLGGETNFTWTLSSQNRPVIPCASSSPKNARLLLQKKTCIIVFRSCLLHRWYFLPYGFIYIELMLPPPPVICQEANLYWCVAKVVSNLNLGFRKSLRRCPVLSTSRQNSEVFISVKPRLAPLAFNLLTLYN